MLSTDVKFTDELFTHQDDETGVQTSWNATRVYEWAVSRNWPVTRVAVDEEHARYCFEKRGFEEERIPDILADPARLKKPIVFVANPDGTHLLIDGTHRYVLYFKFQQESIPAYIVPLDQIEQFIVTDIPQMTEEELMRRSMLPEVRRAFRSQE